MAKDYFTSINLNGNELQNALAQLLGAAPGSPSQGQFWFNTTGNTLQYYNGSEVKTVGEGSGAFEADGQTQITPTTAIVLDEATGNEIALALDYEVNKATSGNDTGLKIDLTDTLSPGTSLLLDLQTNSSSVFNVDSAGVATFDTAIISSYAGISGGARIEFDNEVIYNSSQAAFDFSSIILYGSGGESLDVGYTSSGAFTFSDGVNTLTLDPANIVSDGSNLAIGASGTATIDFASGNLSLTSPDYLHYFTVDNTGATQTGTLNDATGNEVAFSVDYTVNKATSGNDTGIKVNKTDTASPGTSLLMDLQTGGSSQFSVDDAGNVTHFRRPHRFRRFNRKGHRNHYVAR